eukprot:Rmarinus@m.5982
MSQGNLNPSDPSTTDWYYQSFVHKRDEDNPLKFQRGYMDKENNYIRLQKARYNMREGVEEGLYEGSTEFDAQRRGQTRATTQPAHTTMTYKDVHSSYQSNFWQPSKEAYKQLTFKNNFSKNYVKPGTVEHAVVPSSQPATAPADNNCTQAKYIIFPGRRDGQRDDEALARL